jgi:hypothetical protein
VWRKKFFLFLKTGRREGERDQGPGITFKGTPPVLYFLQVGPTS